MHAEVNGYQHIMQTASGQTQLLVMHHMCVIPQFYIDLDDAALVHAEVHGYQHHIMQTASGQTQLLVMHHISGLERSLEQA